MTWKVVFTATASKSFSKLDKYSQQLMQHYINFKVIQLKDPRKIGKPLTKELKSFWRYKVDKFRIICEIDEDKLIILVVKIGHRGKVYE